MTRILILLVGITIFTIATSQSITEDNLNLTVKRGKSVTFPCIEASKQLSENEIFISGTWTSNTGKRIAVLSPSKGYPQDDYKKRATVDNNSYALTLTNIALDDAGNFVCTIMTSEKTTSSSISLRVYASPVVSVEVYPVVLSEIESSSEEKFAECFANEGTLPLSIKWIDPESGITIVSDSDRKIIDSSEDGLANISLSLVMNVNPDVVHDKVYTCVVNDAGENDLTRNAAIKLSVQPRIASFPDRDLVFVKVGKTRRFNCEVSGYPIPVVTWYQGSNEVAKGEGYATLVVNPQNLLESPLLYTCEGKNQLGIVSNFFRIEVQAAPVLISESEEINETETLKLNRNSKTLTLSCQSLSNPPADFSWTIASENATERIEVSNVTRSGNIALSMVRIPHEKFNEKKKIICSASNKLGEDRHEFVVVPPKLQSASAAGWVIGVVLAIVVIVVLLFGLIICWTLGLRKKCESESDTNVEGGCLNQILAPCSRKNKDSIRDSIEGQDNEQIEEAKEEGTEEEKQKLTETEEKPSEKEQNINSSETEEILDEVSGKKKTKAKIVLPNCCWKNSKKQLKEESVEDEEEAEIEEEKEKTVENGDADSGKGDTLMQNKALSKDR